MKITYFIALVFTFLSINIHAANDVTINGFDPSINATPSAPSDALAQAAAIRNADNLLHDSNSPAIGGGPVTLVEFFDYQCHHCTVMSPQVLALAHANPNLRIIYKEFPIRGNASTLAARAALAANLQGKYSAMHEALMRSNKSLDKTNINNLAQSLGLNVEKLNSDMKSSAIDQEISATYRLAQSLGIDGTPAFVIIKSNASSSSPVDSANVVFGEVSRSSLQTLINLQMH